MKETVPTYLCLEWHRLGESGGRRANAPTALLMTEKEITGLWCAIVVQHRPAVPEILFRTEVAHHAAMRWAEAAAADQEYGRRTCDEGKFLGTEPGPSGDDCQPKTGVAGVIEYWSQGCYRYCGWSWWVRVIDAWSRMRAS